ncbi:hypothetical protein [Haloplanus halophilus]|uniref:hypothetical protein n=1 Tax=Haloplanus halophilus TaxID=2949993 RepID=UPI00203BE468|nr:hypothetical protein [Haloplanus sp. GDY1]
MPTDATITPLPDAKECGYPECGATALLARVEPDDVDETPILCPTHRVTFLREVHEA